MRIVMKDAAGDELATMLMDVVPRAGDALTLDTWVKGEALTRRVTVRQVIFEMARSDGVVQPWILDHVELVVE